MPVNAEAAIEVSAYSWVPDFAKGVVRDLRVRWALEELGLSYRERLLDATAPRPEDYLLDQPFGQVPAYVEGGLRMFESGAIVLHLAERSEVLAPRDPVGRARMTSWVLAALNSVEPSGAELAIIDLFRKDEAWTVERRPQVEAFARRRLQAVSDWLGERECLEERFTAGDLMMTTVLRNFRHTDLVASYPNLSAYQARCEARPAFQRALADQLAAFKSPQPA
jgi:glutathione S-transferase